MGLSEALRPISNPETLRSASRAEFIERAANTFAELNYVHPFREGNGRTQEAFIGKLGREYGHDIDMSVITRPRMMEASIATTNDPSSPAMKHVLEDAIEPKRRDAIRSAMSDLEAAGAKPFDYNIRTARTGEIIEGPVLGHDDRVASIVTDKGIVTADRSDLPDELPTGQEKVMFLARSEFLTPERPERREQANHGEPEHSGGLKELEAKKLAERQRDRDDDDRER